MTALLYIVGFVVLIFLIRRYLPRLIIHIYDEYL